MSKKKTWDQELQDLAVELAEIQRTDEEDYRSAVVAIHRTASRAGGPLLKHFTDWSEAFLFSEAAKISDSLSDPAFGYRPITTKSDRASGRDVENLKALVIRLRALEVELTDGETGELPVDMNEAWRVTSATDEDVFLVPVPRRMWRHMEPAEDRRGFTKRVLYAHRLLPVEADGARVTLRPVDSVTRATNSLGFGAALFSGVTFTEDIQDDTFVVTAVALKDRVRTIETAIENSHFDDCFVTVFPELVIDPVSLLEIERQLVEKPFLKGRNPVPPTLIVAGSWHEKHSDGFRNAAHVFDGSGDRVASYSKRLSYGGGRVARERIEPGSDFPILVTRDGLVAFAICLDFCDRQFDGVYGTLDVDFLLVPSCGDEKTMESHLQNASRSDTRYSTATFVVQQAYPKKPRSNGYVLLAADGASPTSKSTKVNATWVRKFT